MLVASQLFLLFVLVKRPVLCAKVEKAIARNVILEGEAYEEIGSRIRCEIDVSILVHGAGSAVRPAQLAAGYGVDVAKEIICKCNRAGAGQAAVISIVEY